MVLRRPRAAVGQRGAGLLLTIVLVCVFVVLSVIAKRQPLWYDELFSYYVARLDGFGSVLSALIAGVDNGPPVDYLLRHFSMRLLGENELAFRLPSILAFLVCLSCVWTFVRRHASTSAATAAAFLPLHAASLHYATEGRAYVLLLALVSLSLLAWQRAAEKPASRSQLVLLSVSLAAAPLSHYYGVLNYVPVAAGETVRSWRRRRISARVLASIGIPLLGLLLVIPFARNAVEMRAHFWASGFGLWSIVNSYQILLGSSLTIVLTLLGLAIVLLVSRRMVSRPAASFESRPSPQPEEVAAAIALASSPVALFVLARLYTNAMTARYAVITIAGSAVVVGFCVDLIGRHSRGLARAIAVAIVLWGASGLFEVMRVSVRSALPESLLESIAASRLPIAVDSPQVFLETLHSLPPAQGQKLIYLTDRERSREILGFDNDEIAIPKLKRVVALRTEPYTQFMAAQKPFYVLVGRERYWLLEALQRDDVYVSPIAQANGYEVYEAMPQRASGPRITGGSN